MDITRQQTLLWAQVHSLMASLFTDTSFLRLLVASIGANSGFVNIYLGPLCLVVLWTSPCVCLQLCVKYCTTRGDGSFCLDV